MSRHLIHDLHWQFFTRMLSAPRVHFDRHSKCGLISRITFNVEQVTGAAAKASIIVVRESLTVLALLGYMLYLNWRLCLVLMAVSPPIAFMVKNIGTRFRRTAVASSRRWGRSDRWRPRRSVRTGKFACSGVRHCNARFQGASDYNRRQTLRLALAELCQWSSQRAFRESQRRLIRDTEVRSSRRRRYRTA